jgi:hypothetical protein
MNLLIGSRALHHWNRSITIRPDTDWDVISDEPIAGCEWHNPNIVYNQACEDYATDDVIEVAPGITANVVSMKGLALIKRSHLWRDLSFDKHITHFHKFGLADAIKEMSDDDREFLDIRTLFTRQKFPQGHPNLMQSKEDFFDDAVDKKYDHDHLHELVAFYDKPLYTRLLRDDTLAWCEKDKWNALTHEDKVKCVAEETNVIAIERFMVPTNWEHNPKLAYFKALRKVCTTLCSGWFRDYAIDFYPEVVSLYNQSLFNNVRSELK